MARTYKNKTDLKKFLPGIGEVEPKGSITTEKIIENQDFEEVSASAQQKPVEEKVAENK